MVLGFGFCCKLFVMKTSLVLGLEMRRFRLLLACVHAFHCSMVVL